jgi:hypothetical protein
MENDQSTKKKGTCGDGNFNKNWLGINLEGKLIAKGLDTNWINFLAPEFYI